MTCSSEFWDALAPHHASTENNFFDLPTLHCILHEIHSPVLVVGAGQGLIVAALQEEGFQCDGVDLNAEMIRYAKLRRGLNLIQADAKALPFANGAYRTVIYATGVVDVMSDEAEIQVLMNEARRIAGCSGKILVGFYKFSSATEEFAESLSLLGNNILSFRELLKISRLSPVQTIPWVAKRAKVGYPAAVMLTFRLWAFSSWHDKKSAFSMHNLFGQSNHAEKLIHAAPEQQTYRDEAEIQHLFARLAIPIVQWKTSDSCHIVGI